MTPKSEHEEVLAPAHGSEAPGAAEKTLGLVAFEACLASLNARPSGPAAGRGRAEYEAIAKAVVEEHERRKRAAERTPLTNSELAKKLVDSISFHEQMERKSDSETAAMLQDHVLGTEDMFGARYAVILEAAARLAKESERDALLAAATELFFGGRFTAQSEGHVWCVVDEARKENVRSNLTRDEAIALARDLAAKAGAR